RRRRDRRSPSPIKIDARLPLVETLAAARFPVPRRHQFLPLDGLVVPVAYQLLPADVLVIAGLDDDVATAVLVMPGLDQHLLERDGVPERINGTRLVLVGHPDPLGLVADDRLMPDVIGHGAIDRGDPILLADGAVDRLDPDALRRRIRGAGVVAM